jgi:prepilin-type N-terminal cleavage/methylation domain-containing protein
VRKKNSAGFTLIELVVVIIIIGVLAGIALPNFTGMREHAFGKEAQANLRLIAAAERIYRLENGSYYISSDLGLTNTNLKLSLSEENWDYDLTGGGNAFTATAVRGLCTYTVDEGSDVPLPSGTCP